MTTQRTSSRSEGGRCPISSKGGGEAPACDAARWGRDKDDLPTGPKEPRSTVLSVEEEAIIVAFRRHTLLPLEDCLYSLQPTIPHLTRSSLHRCRRRHGISRRVEIAGEKHNKKKFKAYPMASSTSTSRKCRSPRTDLRPERKSSCLRPLSFQGTDREPIHDQCLAQDVFEAQVHAKL
jgi:hypothetical protein